MLNVNKKHTIHINTHTHKHTYTHINTHTHKHTYTHIHTHTHKHTYTHTHTHKHTHTNVHKHTYTHTHACKSTVFFATLWSTELTKGYFQDRYFYTAYDSAWMVVCSEFINFFSKNCFNKNLTLKNYSAASSGIIGNLTYFTKFSWPPLESGCRFQRYVFYLHMLGRFCFLFAGSTVDPRKNLPNIRHK